MGNIEVILMVPAKTDATSKRSPFTSVHIRTNYELLHERKQIELLIIYYAKVQVELCLDLDEQFEEKFLVSCILRLG